MRMVPRDQFSHNLDDNWRHMPPAALGRHLRRYKQMRSRAETPAEYQYARNAVIGIMFELRRRNGEIWMVAA